MANFPHWINKKSSTASSSSTSNLSPRQVANKAYSLAIKKLDRDDKRRRPHYTVRERLLLSNTMAKAEDLLNKRTPRSNRRVLASEFDDDLSICPPATHIPPPAPIQVQPQPEEKPATPTSITTSTSNQTFQSLEPKTLSTVASSEAPAAYITMASSPTLPSAQEIAVSLAVVAAVAYNSLVAATVNDNQQKAASFCRPMMIPSHSMTSFKTIV
ncbi:hypothetical protein MAM1_0289d09286 [Mucor ambiguus]|uniref:Uncharacterized protein n=1 Tax=Mucor ambiguus TaxID=91626 RepID=A0A0C9MQP4_9FUNG|nr:hypothetical protein MAM1_0289d09286 [Mucor ambiguus]